MVGTTSRGFCRVVYIVGGTQTAMKIVQHIAGYAIEPSRERCLSAKLRDINISLDKRVLCKVVAQLHVSQCLVQEEAPYRRLIFHDQTVECRAVVKLSHLRDKREIVVLLHLFFILVAEVYVGNVVIKIVVIVFLFFLLTLELAVVIVAHHEHLAHTETRHKQSYAYKTVGTEKP